MTNFSVLMASIKQQADGFSIDVTEDWLQGRTLYGGLSAAICHEAAVRQFADLPPLRSAQFSFAGPASGHLKMTSAILRQGKSTVFITTDLTGEAGLATRANFCFGAARESSLHYAAIPAPSVEEPEQCRQFFKRLPGLDFVQHFDGRIAGGNLPFSRAPDPTLLLWLRHRDERAAASATTLIALADAPPPAAMVMIEKPGPLSTMTWGIDLLTDRPETAGGWWLAQSTAENASGGYSSQAMTLWNAARQPVMVSRQNIAVFV